MIGVNGITIPSLILQTVSNKVMRAMIGVNEAEFKNRNTTISVVTRRDEGYDRSQYCKVEDGGFLPVTCNK